MSKRHYMARGPAFFLSALLVPVFVMAGCEVPPPEDDPGADPQVQPGDQPQNDTIEFSSNLSDIHDSGVSGEIRVQRPRANGVATFIVEVEGLPYEGEFPAMVHRGTCDELEDGVMDWGDQQQQQQQQQEQMRQDQVGGQVAELSPVRGFADGTGMSQTTLGIDELPTQQDMSVRIHGEGQQPIACADIDQGDWDERDGVW